ncbi:protein SLX4IP [Discoglossus pictus]
MTSNKLVVKCGNFAVLVDLHVLPQGTSKDTSWFSDHEKEEVCMLLKDTIDSRVRHHIESRRQQSAVKRKEYTQASPLFLKGNSLRIAAYFIKRWVKLRCIVKKQYREMHVFPDRFVVCVSQLEPASKPWSSDTAIVNEEPCCGKSGYFAEHLETEACKISDPAPEKQAVLRNIVKKTKTTKDTSYGAEATGDREVPPSLGLAALDKESVDNKHETLSNMQSETKCRTVGQAKYCINTTENSLELPVPQVENYVNHRQPCETSSQQKPHSTERLKTQDLREDPSWICESAVAEQQQSHRTRVTQHKRRRHSSEGKKESCKKAHLRDDTFIHQNMPISKSYTSAVEDQNKVHLNSIQYVPADGDTTRANVPAKRAISINTSAPCILQDKPSVASLTSSTRTEENLEENKRYENQPKKLKLQRSKKLH